MLWRLRKESMLLMGMALPLILVRKILWISVFKQNQTEESPTLALVEEEKCILCRENSTCKGLVVKEETGCLKNHCSSDRVERVQRVEKGGWNGKWGAYHTKKAVSGTSISGPEHRYQGFKCWAETALAHGLEFTFCFLIRDTPIHTPVVVLQFRNYRQATLLFFNWGSKTAEDPAIHFISLGLPFLLWK